MYYDYSKELLEWMQRWKGTMALLFIPWEKNKEGEKMQKSGSRKLYTSWMPYDSDMRISYQRLR